MITKVQAKLIADNANNFLPTDASLLNETRTGNVLLDEANHLVIWNAGRGMYTGYLPLSIAAGVYTQTIVINFISALNSLGYTVTDKQGPNADEIKIEWS